MVSVDTAPTRQWLVAALILIATLSVPFGLARQDVVNVNETQRLLPPIEMIERDDWVLPTIESELYLTKPPLIYWMIGGSYIVSGAQSVATGRIPGAVTCLLIAFSIALIGRRESNARVGLWSAILLLSAFEFRRSAQEAEIDPVLAGAVLGLVYWQWRATTAERRWLRLSLIAGLFAGATLLLKGPVLLPFLLASTLAVAFVERPMPARLVASLGVILGTGLVMFLPWGLLVIDRLGVQAAWNALDSESIQRINSSAPINSGPIYFYVTGVAAAFLPWTWLLGFWGSRGLRTSARTAASPFIRVAGIFAAAALIIFSLIAGKEVKYLLPILPFMALCAGLVMDWLVHSSERVAGRGAAFGLGATALLGLVAPVAYFTELGRWMDKFGETGLMLLAGSAACLGVLWLLNRGERERAAVLLAVGITMVVVSTQEALKVRANELKSARPLAAEIARLTGRGQRVFRYRVNRVDSFYLRRHTKLMPQTEPAAALPADSVLEYTVVTPVRYADSLMILLGRPTTLLSRNEAGSARYALLNLRNVPGVSHPARKHKLDTERGRQQDGP